MYLPIGKFGEFSSDPFSFANLVHVNATNFTRTYQLQLTNENKKNDYKN